MREWEANPLWQVPAEFRVTAWEFWAYWSHVIKDSQMAVGCRVRHWIADGMTLDDFVSAVRHTMRPAVAAENRWAGDAMAALAAAVEKAMSDRRIREREARFKAECESARSNVASRDEFAKLRDAMFQDAGEL